MPERKENDFYVYSVSLTLFPSLSFDSYETYEAKYNKHTHWQFLLIDTLCEENKKKGNNLHRLFAWALNKLSLYVTYVSYSMCVPRHIRNAIFLVVIRLWLFSFISFFFCSLRFVLSEHCIKKETKFNEKGLFGINNVRRVCASLRTTTY